MSHKGEMTGKMIVENSDSLPPEAGAKGCLNLLALETATLAGKGTNPFGALMYTKEDFLVHTVLVKNIFLK